MAEAVDDDLDYVVEFPSPTPNLGDDEPSEVAEAEATDQRTYGPIYDESNLNKEPVIMLIGWMGCDDKHLAKYSEIFEKRGFITIRYIPPVEDMFYDQKNKLQKTAGKLLDLLSDLDLERNPIFFHVFSNGGGYVYRNITELLFSDTRYRKLDIKGCMFDSCPSPGTVFRAAMALVSTYQGNILVKYLYLFLAVIYLIMFRTWDKFIWTFRGLKGQRKFSGVIGYYSAMMHDPVPYPQLYLYSKADRMIESSYIEAVIRHRRSLGIEIMSVCWDDSAHVAHLRKHRESYMKKCYDFIETCLHK